MQIIIGNHNIKWLWNIKNYCPVNLTTSLPT